MTAPTEVDTPVGPERAGGQGLDPEQYESGDRAIYILLTDPVAGPQTDLVITCRDDAYEVWAKRGMIRFQRFFARDGHGFEYRVIEQIGDNPIENQDGRAVVSRIAYSKDSSPGVNVGNFSGTGSFGDTVFEVTQQYVSTFTGTAFDDVLVASLQWAAKRYPPSAQGPTGPFAVNLPPGIVEWRYRRIVEAARMRGHDIEVLNTLLGRGILPAVLVTFGLSIVIQNGRITAVGANTRVPGNARVIDAKGRPVTPGIFVAGTNLAAVEVDLEHRAVAERDLDARIHGQFLGRE